jgi:precorrin-6A synthase
MRTLSLIGIGAGDPEHVTMQAVAALNRVDVFFVMDKGSQKDDLVQLRRDICARYITHDKYRFVEIEDPVRDLSIVSYPERVQRWHEARVALYQATLSRELGEHGRGGILVWGDPMLYDSSLRIVEQLCARDPQLTYDVIPGISSIQVLCARHRITLNQIGGAVHITTGRRLQQGFPAGVHDVLVMLDGECSFRTLDEPELQIYWGAYLGTAHEILIAGKLGEVATQIEQVRADARERHGWIMDTYLLRREQPRD